MGREWEGEGDQTLFLPLPFSHHFFIAPPPSPSSPLSLYIRLPSFSIPRSLFQPLLVSPFPLLYPIPRSPSISHPPYPFAHPHRLLTPFFLAHFFPLLPLPTAPSPGGEWGGSRYLTPDVGPSAFDVNAGLFIRRRLVAPHSCSFFSLFNLFSLPHPLLLRDSLGVGERRGTQKRKKEKNMNLCQDLQE